MWWVMMAAAIGEAEIASLGTIVEGIAVVCYVVGHNGDCRCFSFGDTHWQV